MKKKQLLKGSNVRIADLTRRILSYVQTAYFDYKPDDPESSFHSGVMWYRDALSFARQLATSIPDSETYAFLKDHDHELNVSRICGVIAVLSPQVTWSQNMKLAREFIRTGKCNTTGERLGKCQVIMLCGTDDEVYENISKKGLKTRAFFMNIRHPEVEHVVTIDRHAIAAALQLPTDTSALDASWQKVTDLQYAFFAEAYIKAAKRFSEDSIHITPQQCQAIAWVQYRKVRNLK
jgi:hypothetical protein